MGTERKVSGVSGMHDGQAFLFALSSVRDRGTGIAQWLERQTSDWKVEGSNPSRSGGRIFFFMVNFLCWILFRYPFHHRVTAVARKRSRSFCQKCRWPVTTKHAWSDMVHGCMVYTERAEKAAVSCCTSQASAVTTPLRWIFRNAVKLFTHVESHASAVSLLESCE